MWDDLTMDQKARWMAFFAKNGIYNRDVMKDRYNSMYLSKMEKVAQDNYRNWSYQDQDQALVHALNDNTYDYNKWFADNPVSMENSDTHWTDRYKTAYHPTFSDESMYSGVVDRNYNPEGRVGGRWDGDVFVPYGDQYGKGGSIHINPKNRGKFTETMRRTGKSAQELLHSKNPLTRKRAQFAINARKWNHRHQEGDAMLSDGTNQPVRMPKPVFQDGNMYLANDRYVFLPEFDVTPQEETAADVQAGVAPYLNVYDTMPDIVHRNDAIRDSSVPIRLANEIVSMNAIDPVGNGRYVPKIDSDTGSLYLDDLYSRYVTLGDDSYGTLVGNAMKVGVGQYRENAMDEFMANRNSYTNSQVKDIQRMLLDEGYYDSVFDDKVSGLKNMSKDQVRELQQKLVDGKFYRNNSQGEVDGVVGKRTREAYRKYLGQTAVDGYIGPDTETAYRNFVEKGNAVEYSKPNTKAEAHKCAKYIKDYMNDSGYDMNKTGIQGHAWMMFKNIGEHGGDVYYNIYDGMGDVKDESDLVNKTKSGLKSNPLDYGKLKQNDVVGIYIPGSDAMKEAIRDGYTKNTHVGIVDGYDKDGMPMIRHNINGDRRVERADRLTGAAVSGQGRPRITVAATPVLNERMPKIEWNDRKESDLEYRFTDPDSVSGNRKDMTRRFMDGLASSKETMGQLFPNVDMDQIEKAAIGILGREGNFFEVTEGTKQKVSNSLRDILKNDEDKTVRTSGLKLSALTSPERVLLDIKDRDDLSENLDKQARAVMFILSKNYDYFNRYRQQHPDLGISDDEVLNLALLSYNQGMGKMYDINPDSMQKFRNYFDPEYRFELPFDETPVGQVIRRLGIGDMGLRSRYERNPRVGTPYVVNARNVMGNIVPKGNNTNAYGGYLDGIIWDNNGQWAHPGQITGITGTKDGTDITMNGVGSWILGIDDLGNRKLMKPGRNYHFKGGKVVEYPIMYQFGGLLGNTRFADYAETAKMRNMRAGLPYGRQPRYVVQDVIAPAVQSLYDRHPGNVRYLPKNAQDYVNTIVTQQRNPTADNKQGVVDFLWAMENEHGVGMNADGTYSRYQDPNGRDYDVGPGLVIGSAIEDKPFYTRQELDDSAYNYYNDSMNKLQPLYDDKYGVGQFDNLDDRSKMVIFDVMYRAGQNGVNPTTWPNLFDAAYDNDTQRLLKESRTRFKNKGRWNYDNARVKRIGEYLYPEMFDYKYKNSLDRNLNVIKRQYGGLIKPFSYYDIPIVRFDEGGYTYI